MSYLAVESSGQITLDGKQFDLIKLLDLLAEKRIVLTGDGNSVGPFHLGKNNLNPSFTAYYVLNKYKKGNQLEEYFLSLKNL